MLNEALQKVAKWLIDLGEETQKAFSNGWQWGDSWGFVDDAFAAPSALKQMPAVWALIKPGLSDEQRALLVQYIKDEYDVPNDEAEAKVEALVAYIFDSEKFFRTFFAKPTT